MLSSNRRVISDEETPKRKLLPFLKRKIGSPLRQGEKANGTVKNSLEEKISVIFNMTASKRRAFEESSTFYSHSNDEEQRDADSKERGGQFSLAVVEPFTQASCQECSPLTRVFFRRL